MPVNQLEQQPEQAPPPAPPPFSNRRRPLHRGRRRPLPQREKAQPAQNAPGNPPISGGDVSSENSLREMATPARAHSAHSHFSIRKATEELTRITDTLQKTVEDFQDVLRLLETAEHEKQVNEKELESLRRAVSRLHRPRESGHKEPERPLQEAVAG